MIFTVYLTAFRSKDETRDVEVPDDRMEGLDDFDLLDRIFHYGQNDFQPQKCPSVSVGDIIKLRDFNYWIVLPTGFKQLTVDQFSKIEGKIGEEAYNGAFDGQE